MTVYRVVEHWHVHHCAAQPYPHPWMITRTVAEVVDGGRCLTPVTLPATDPATGHSIAVRVACRRRVPLADRCPTCTPHVEVARISLHLTAVKGDR